MILKIVLVFTLSIIIEGLPYVSVEDDFNNLCYNDELGFSNIYRPPNRCEKLPYIRVEKREYLTHTFWCIIINNINGNISRIELEYDRPAVFKSFLPSENIIILNSFDSNVKQTIVANQTKFIHKISKNNLSITNGFFPNTTIGRLISIKVDGQEICDSSRLNEPDPIFPNQEVLNSLRYYETCQRINRIRLSKMPNMCEQLNEVNLLLAYYPVSKTKIWCLTIDPQLALERYDSNTTIDVHIKMSGDTNFIEEHGSYVNDSRILPYKVLYQDGTEFKISATNSLTIAIQPKNINLSITGIQSILINGIDTCLEENASNMQQIFNLFGNLSSNETWSVRLSVKDDLLNQSQYICNGIIIGPTAVIAVADCIQNVTDLIVFDSKNNCYDVTNATTHGNYYQRSFDYDLSILKLERMITFDKEVEPICHMMPKTLQIDLFDFLVSNITNWEIKERNTRNPNSCDCEPNISPNDIFFNNFYNEATYCLEYREKRDMNVVFD